MLAANWTSTLSRAARLPMHAVECDAGAAAAAGDGQGCEWNGGDGADQMLRRRRRRRDAAAACCAIAPAGVASGVVRGFFAWLYLCKSTERAPLRGRPKWALCPGDTRTGYLATFERAIRFVFVCVCVSWLVG